ncbi:MAG: SusC/RagA family TonB-linked outer membrane protein [Chitinophagaceae bacterium]
MKVLLQKMLRKARFHQCHPVQKFFFITFFVLFALLFAFPVSAQNNILVKGKITGENGQAIARATIAVKGSAAGTTADDNGNFEINAPSNGILVISAVSFETQEVNVSNRQTLDVNLISLERIESEVVVIGYGTARKRDVTGSTVSVKGETLNEIKAPNIYNQLQGRAAGVDIQNNSSNIGATGQIRIRGNRSLTHEANNPLIVVDGMAYGGNLNDINPENIASIDILKDASATAIFGSRGASGVIIITTKRGTNQKAVTSYNGYVGISSAIDTWRLFTGQEYAQFKADAGIGNSNAAVPSPTTNPYALTADEQANLAAGVNTDWQNLALTKGIRTSHDVGVRGGNERTQFYFGLGYFRETGVIPDQDLTRFSLNVNLDHKMSERIKVGFSTFATLNRSNRTGFNNAFTTRLGPLFKPYKDDGTFNWQPAIQQGVDNTQLNPLAFIGNDDKFVAFTRRMQIQDNFYGELKILKDLKFRTTFGFGWSQTINNNYNGVLQFPGQTLTNAQATLSQNNSEGWQYTVNNSLEYNKTFGKHKLQAQALQEVQKNWFRGQQFNGTGIPADFMQDYNWLQVNTITPQGGSFNERALIGYMGRAIYSFDDKYVFTGTVRTDGASVLAPGYQWVTYPAFSAAWNLDREQFMSGVKLVNSLKLRVGWGISSTQNINPYQTLGTLGTNFYNFGSGSGIGTNYVPGYLAGSAPNPGLSWEKSAGLNIGVDFSILNNRLSGSFEYFNIQTNDILLNKLLPQSTGLTQQQTNVGKTSTKGMEFTLSSVNVKTKSGFTWNTDFNLFFSREKIVQLTDPNLKIDRDNGWFVGQPISIIYDYKNIGIWQTSEATQAAAYGVKPGDIKLEDLNKDNVLNGDDRQVLGSFQPDFVAGMTNHFEYKNFDLNIVMFGRFGQKVVATYLTGGEGGGGGYGFFMNSRVQQLKVDYWTPTNPTNAFPQPDAGRDALMYTSTLSYRDGSFIKIRTIDLGYNFTSNLLGKAGIQSLRAYVSAQNPFILWAPMVRDNLGIDPEGNNGGDPNVSNGSVPTQGGGITSVSNRAITINMGVPPTRQIIFGLNLRF